MVILNNTHIDICDIVKLKELNVKKPEIQRIIDIQKVEDIVSFQLEFYKKHGFFNFTASGPINIHIWQDQYLLVDGQHRLEAVEKLHRDHAHKIGFYVLFVEVNSQEQLEANYNMINKNTPLPDFSNFSSIDKNIPEQVAATFQLTWSDIWAKNSRARRPHLYFNYFQESLAFICQETGKRPGKLVCQSVYAWHSFSKNKMRELAGL